MAFLLGRNNPCEKHNIAARRFIDWEQFPITSSAKTLETWWTPCARTGSTSGRIFLRFWTMPQWDADSPLTTDH